MKNDNYKLNLLIIQNIYAIYRVINKNNAIYGLFLNF